MAIKKQQLKRVFIIKTGTTETTLSDPNVNMTPEQVMSFYAGTYPELTNSNVHGPNFKNDRIEYHFKTTIGVKG